jgi:GTP-binding protein EngB required for normal cell division
LNDERRELELNSAKAGFEAELRRVNEELEQNKKSQQIMEDLQKTQEEKKRLEEKIKLDNIARKIEEDARARVEQEVWLRREAEKNLEEGIPPIKYHTGDQIAEKRESLGYQEGLLHIAITGCSGSGKSSLINAVRGYKNPKTGFAAFTSLDTVINTISPGHLAQTGTSETTTQIQRYADPHHARRGLAWYDVPGAGTLRVRDWQYFNDQGLYIFDTIMIAVGDRITKTDVDLLFHCKRFDIPTFFVRSKADQHIRNSMDEPYDEADEDEVRTGYIRQTRAEFNSILTKVGLPQQKIYIVGKETLRLLNDGKRPKPKSIIDEEELIRDVNDALHKWSTAVPANE